MDILSKTVLLKVNNGSNKNMKMEVNLIQTCNMKGSPGGMSMIYSQKLSGQAPGQSAPVMHSIKVPQISPSGMNEYPSVDISYSINVEVLLLVFTNVKVLKRLFPGQC